MSFELEHLREPKLQFAEYFEHEDTKTGLAEYGPFGKSVAGLHPTGIRVGFVGTGESIAGAREWLAECGSAVESDAKIVRGAERDTFFGEEREPPERVARYVKIINRDFVGFNRESTFGCEFQTNTRWEKKLQHRDLTKLLNREDTIVRISELVDLLDAQVESLATTSPAPNVIILALTAEMVERAFTARVAGNFFLDLRRAIKARSMKWGVPIQLLQRRTVEGKGGELQDRATRAWNFCTAQYYKADGIPWRPRSVGQDCCFVGISFYLARDAEAKLTMQSSVAQAFDYLGQGLVLRGEPFEWDVEKMGRTPHLPHSAARKLIARTLKEYQSVRGVPPQRVVIHKTSEFWGPEHIEHNEIDGFHEGVADVAPSCHVDLLAIRQTGLRLFREGIYPPLRGTYARLEESEHFLFTMGYIPYLQTYPGSHVPEPWQVVQHVGGSSKKDLLAEVLALTKMNVNNCSFADGVPITISFSRKIGEIMRHVPEGGVVQPMYKFYM